MVHNINIPRRKFKTSERVTANISWKLQAFKIMQKKIAYNQFLYDFQEQFDKIKR